MNMQRPEICSTHAISHCQDFTSFVFVVRLFCCCSSGNRSCWFRPDRPLKSQALLWEHLDQRENNNQSWTLLQLPCKFGLLLLFGSHFFNMRLSHKHSRALKQSLPSTNNEITAYKKVLDANSATSQPASRSNYQWYQLQNPMLPCLELLHSHIKLFSCRTTSLLCVCISHIFGVFEEKFTSSSWLATRNMRPLMLFHLDSVHVE